MNIKKLLKASTVVVALFAVCMSTAQADENYLTETSKQKLLQALDSEDIMVVMADQNGSLETVKFNNIATTSEDVVYLENLEAPTQPSGIEFVSNESCSSVDNCGATCCPTNCSTGCGTCGTYCQSCCEPKTAFLGGVEAIFYWVDGNNNGNGDIRTFDINRNLVRRYSSSGLDDDGGVAAPRVWVGVQRDNWGFVARWWDLNLGDGSNNPLIGGGDLDGFGNGNEFRSYAFDAEVLRAFCFDSCWGNFSFGYRHGRMATGGGTSASAFIGPDLVRGSTYGESVFNGDGFTFALELHKRIGCGVNLFAKARGSFLWGDAKASAAVTSSVNSPVGNTAGAQWAAAGTDRGHMSIAEIQAGLEWTHELKCYPATAFVRCAFEWQTWQGDSDVEARVISNSFVVPGAAISSRASAGDQSLDLFGLAISTGFTF